MKPFVKFLSMSACLFTCLLTLSACETYEGLKQDIQNIDLSNLSPARSISEDEKHSDFLVDGDCPEVQIVDELNMLSEFSAGNTMTLPNLVSTVSVSEAQSTCAYNDRSVTVDLKLSFDGKLGPKGRRSTTEKPFFSYPFFVAVTNANGKILAKEIFAASMTYNLNQDEQLYFETLRQIIPVDTRIQGSRYNVMVGFQLTESQLKYNRQLIQAQETARIAAEKVEMQRLQDAAAAAKKSAAETMDKTINKTMGETVTIPRQVTVPQPSASTTINQNTINEAAETITVPKAKRAGPFDIFKTDN